MCMNVIIETTYVDGYVISGNHYVAIAINMTDPSDAHYFYLDDCIVDIKDGKNVVQSAFITAQGWAYQPD